ncbi:TPA: IS110 family transposase, partial [Bacillus cereus]|nr:IS110 family transposase [Bacillus cereus]
MKHVIAFDISMGKSYMVIYNAQKQCVFESEIKHSKPEFKKLEEKIHELTDKTG